MYGNLFAWVTIVGAAYFIARRKGALLVVWGILALASLGPVLEHYGVIPPVPVATEP